MKQNSKTLSSLPSCQGMIIYLLDKRVGTPKAYKEPSLRKLANYMGFSNVEVIRSILIGATTHNRMQLQTYEKVFFTYLAEKGKENENK